jgi:TolA-binding protein
MRKLAIAILASVLLLAVAQPRPAAAEDKGIIALQQSVSLLMSQVADLQKSMNTQLGMMQGLVTQNTDTVNKLSSAIDAIQHTLNGNALVSSQHQTDIGRQFQQLADTMAQLQAHLQKMDDTLKQIHQMQQTIPAPTAPAGGTMDPNAAAGTVAPGAPPAANAPSLAYQKALNDFTSGSSAAQSELAGFIRAYPNDPSVPDATYFLGTVFMQKGQYNEAINQFDQLIMMYPDNAKTPMAELNKGISLSKQGNRTAAISELRALTKNHPGTEAARQADIELKKLSPR